MTSKSSLAWILVSALFLFIGVLSATSRADVVYTTAVTAGSASDGNVKTPSDANSYQIGTLPAGTAGLTLSFDKTGGNTNYAMVQFTTSSSSPLLKLTGINANLFFDGTHKKDAATTLSNATATWHLYQGLTSIGTFSQTWNPMTHPAGATTGPNTYQNTAISAQYDLTAATQYSLVLETITGIDLTSDSSNDSVHWTYYDQAPAASGQTFTINGAGYFSGAYNNTIGTSQNLAFDLTASAVPEPGTFALGTILVLGGTGGWWIRKKRDRRQKMDANT